jgi:hypothetical protein
MVDAQVICLGAAFVIFAFVIRALPRASSRLSSRSAYSRCVISSSFCVISAYSFVCADIMPRLFCSHLIPGLPFPSYSSFPLFLHATAITYRSAFFVLRTTVGTDSNIFKHWRFVRLKASKQRSVAVLELHFLLFSLRASDSACLKTRVRRSAYSAMILKSKTNHHNRSDPVRGSSVKF